MLSKEKNRDQKFLFSTLEDQLDQQHSLFKLANKIDWQSLEYSFKNYSPNGNYVLQNLSV